MKRLILALMLCSGIGEDFAEAQLTSPANDNPLIQIHDQVQRVLSDARIPVSADQETQILTMMEDRRKASEDLFGNLMDFRSGPTQGADAERLRSAIEWLRNEFLTGMQRFLTAEQLSTWNRYDAAQRAAADRAGQAPRPATQQQTQFVRINNNTFTSENNAYVARTATNTSGAEVIQRGGQGAWHGNAQMFFQSEKLNAGRRFAANKPPYQERQPSFDLSGPLLRNRLTAGFSGSLNESKNVDTINATLPDGTKFALGITKPSINRSIGTRGTYQINSGNSLTYNFSYRTNKNENQGVGGFIMPERAYTTTGSNYAIDLKQFSALSARSIFEVGFNFSRSISKTIPATEGFQINVLDAFSRGGAQNKAESTSDVYSYTVLYTRLGEKLSIKAGGEGAYRPSRTVTETNFTGTYSFSGLTAFNGGVATSFRVNRGTPLLDFHQMETAYFLQTDWKLTPRLTFMSGMRYEYQTNIQDSNNIDPRLSVAYGIGRTVIRTGAGIFHQRVTSNVIQTQMRQNGVTQYEVILDNPTYDPANPDPFQSGTVRTTFPSVRVLDPHLAAPYNAVVMLSWERTFLSNLFLSVLYDRGWEIHRLRTRNINAPRDITSAVLVSCRPEQTSEALGCVRPDPTRGNILSTESTAGERSNNLRVNYRQRFGIFNVSASYQMQVAYSDATPNGVGNLSFGITADGLNSDQYNLRADRTRSSFPLHTYSGSINAQLPLGVFLTQSISGNSGRTYTVMTGKDDNHDTAVNDRPNGVKRNSAPGPKQLLFGYNLSKAFFFGDSGANGRGGSGTRKNVNMYANISNAFNRPNYSQPSGYMTSPNFGKSTSAGDPRKIEVGARFQF